METFRAVILSDIHFGHLSGHNDFCAAGIENDSIVSGSTSILQSLNRCLKSYDFIDEIIITGDLTSYATPYEFFELEKKLEKLKGELDNYDSQFIYALGNHDVNWNISEIASSCNYTDFDKAHFQKISNRIHLDFNFENHNYQERLEAIPNVGRIVTPKAEIIVLNTGSYSNKYQKYKNGKLGTEQIEWLRNQKVLDQSKWQILAMHHHPHKYPYPHYVEDISHIEEGDVLEEIISKYGFDIVVHGHRHHPIFFTRTETDWLKPVNFLCAGSLSVRASERAAGQIPNMFHVIELENKCKKTEAACGKLYNYRFTSVDGWTSVKADSFVNLDSEMCFGEILSRTELESSFEIIIDALTKESDTIVSFPTLSELPYGVRCQSLKNINEVVSIVCKKKGIRVSGIYPDEVYIVGRKP